MGDAEVHHPCHAVGGEDDICGFDIPVQDALAMGVAQPGQQFHRNGHRALGGQPGFATDQFGKHGAFHVLENQEGQFVFLPRIEQWHHVGMG